MLGDRRYSGYVSAETIFQCQGPASWARVASAKAEGLDHLQEAHRICACMFLVVRAPVHQRLQALVRLGEGLDHCVQLLLEHKQDARLGVVDDVLHCVLSQRVIDWYKVDGLLIARLQCRCKAPKANPALPLLSLGRQQFCEVQEVPSGGLALSTTTNATRLAYVMMDGECRSGHLRGYHPLRAVAAIYGAPLVC